MVTIPTLLLASDDLGGSALEFGDEPWHMTSEILWKQSPLAYAENIKTPLMITHSLQDFRCAISEAEILYKTLKALRRESLEHVVNLSVNQTLSRTVITAGLTLLSVLALYLFGGEALSGFAFTMLVGIVSGTYSTVFIASSIATKLSARATPARATRPGMPVISFSMGKVTSVSISSGASAGTAVLICTCGFVMSGTASIGSRSADQTPAAISASAPITTKTRWWRETSKTR